MATATPTPPAPANAGPTPATPAEIKPSSIDLAAVPVSPEPKPRLPNAVAVGDTHITCTPGVLGGKPCVAGTRIAVEHVYVWVEHNKWSVDYILEQFPTLTRADVHAALAYAYDRREALERKLDEDDAWFEEQVRLQESTPFMQKLRARQREMRGDAVSP